LAPEITPINPERSAIFVADAHRDDGKRFVVRADEKLTAFLELEVAIRAADSGHLGVQAYWLISHHW